ncbi:hypothetical protein FB567DRAFT_183911 [Paraphoma chrysanthemicola]|uniref:Uncharacterized protein n=1 Tax=Paraphoma chrysanthemicola TaxID=798071 RepID=A0A8K0VTQ1_9PLEO|nr:hypothetical protein FB567DRAFT_183911 [Paraphoma chrysanthemicola]
MSAAIQKNSPTLVEMPPELVSQIVMTKDFKGRHILDAADVSNIRLASRRMNAKSFHDFAGRFFTIRRHVVNAASFKCIQEISQDPNFSSYVREVSFVPLRINYPLGDTHYCPLKDWYPVFGDAYQALIEEQEAFDRSKGNSGIITEALSAFPNLGKIRIEAYPSEINYAGWQAWGTKTTFRKIGIFPYPEETEWSRVHNSLIDQKGQEPANICAHYQIIVDALGSLSAQKNSQNWTLDIALLMICRDDRIQLFDLSSQNFLRIRDRIQSIYLNATMGIYDSNWRIDGPWLRKYLEVRPGIVSLTLDQESAPSEYLMWLRLDNIRRFELLSCDVAPKYVGRFLKRHSNTLKSIRICHVLLWDEWDSTDISWSDIFELMMCMPHLNAIDLCSLEPHSGIPDNDDLEHMKVLECQVGSETMIARGREVVRALHSTIEAKMDMHLKK